MHLQFKKNFWRELCVICDGGLPGCDGLLQPLHQHRKDRYIGGIDRRVEQVAGLRERLDGGECALLGNKHEGRRGKIARQGAGKRWEDILSSQKRMAKLLKAVKELKINNDCVVDYQFDSIPIELPTYVS